MRRYISAIILIFAGINIYAYNFSYANDAIQYLQKGESKQFFDKLKKSVGFNDLVSQFYMAQCLEYGIATDIDLQNAFLMYRRAAERGFPPAMKELARCYSDGIGVEANESRAREWEVRYGNRKESLELTDIVGIHLSGGSQHSHNELASNSGSSASQQKSNKDSHKQSAPQTQPRPAVKQSAEKTVAKVPEKSNIAAIPDVDKDIPVSRLSNTNLFALVIANENYQEAATVENALNDGEIFAEYCKKTLGIPATNVQLVKNATLNNIKREINRMRQIADAYKGDASFLIYYAGHGLPDEKTRDAYLMPVDGFHSDISTCYSLAELYDAIANMPSKKTIVMLDACFSGATRDGDMIMAARGVALKPKTTIPSGNTIVFSSASGDETAYPYSEKKHGLFTYFLLKNLKETKGETTLGELADYVQDNVMKKSIIINGKSQTPTANASQELGNEWKSWKLK